MPPATSPNGRHGEVAPFCFLGEWIYEPRATEERAGQEEEEDSRDEDCTFDRPALSLSHGHCPGPTASSSAQRRIAPLWAPLETAGIRKQLVCPWPSSRTHFQAPATGSGGRTDAPWPACPPHSTAPVPPRQPPRCSTNRCLGLRPPHASSPPVRLSQAFARAGPATRRSRRAVVGRQGAWRRRKRVWWWGWPLPCLDADGMRARGGRGLRRGWAGGPVVIEFNLTDFNWNDNEGK
jgi:hypothetical protein